MSSKNGKRRLTEWQVKQTQKGMQAILDRKVEEWHRSDIDMPLHDYLEMEKEEYADWVATGTIPQRFLH